MKRIVTGFVQRTRDYWKIQKRWSGVGSLNKKVPLNSFSGKKRSISISYAMKIFSATSS